VNTAFRKAASDYSAGCWRYGAGVCDHGARPSPFDDAIRPGKNQLGHFRSSDAEEYAVSFSGRRAWRFREDSVRFFRRKLAGFLCTVRPERHAMSGAKEIAGHGQTHDAESEKGEICHIYR
jgi:hypothetical protein